jgi:hypothetical protein
MSNETSDRSTGLNAFLERKRPAIARRIAPASRGGSEAQHRLMHSCTGAQCESLALNELLGSGPGSHSRR